MGTPVASTVVRLGMVLAMLTAVPHAEAQEPAPEAESAATEPAPATPTVPAKVAIVIAGDPDPALRDAALQLEKEMAATGLRMPSDPALRAALRGEPAPTKDDGLDKLRATRRTLGLDPKADTAAYRRIGTVSGADALAVLHGGTGVLVEVFDVTAGRFYESVLKWTEATPERRVAFVQRRAETARARRVTSITEPTTRATATAVSAESTETSAQLNTVTAPNDDRKARKWFKKNWPYFVVGALLAGGVTYLVIDRRNDNGGGAPVLRFRPGESP